MSHYVGAGEFANFIAHLDGLEKAKRASARRERDQVQKELVADQELDRLIDEVGCRVRGIKTAVLLAHGFHTHKRQWRRYVSKQIDEAIR